MDDVTTRAIQRHEHKVVRRAKKGQKPRCEVIQCGPKGPHRCEARGWSNGDGRIVCTHHRWEAPHVAVFTIDEAVALYRRRRSEGKDWLPMWLTDRSA